MMLRSPRQDTAKARTFCIQCLCVNLRWCASAVGNLAPPKGRERGGAREVGVSGRGRVRGAGEPGQWAGTALARERRSARGVNSTLRRGGAGERRAGAGCERPGTCHRSRVAGCESPDAARPFVRSPPTAASVAFSGHQGLGSRLRPLRRPRPLRPAQGRGESAGEAAVRPAQNWGLEGA